MKLSLLRYRHAGQLGLLITKLYTNVSSLVIENPDETKSNNNNTVEKTNRLDYRFAWASTYTKKWGGPNRKIIGSKNLVFSNLQKRQKSKSFFLGGGLIFFIRPAIYSTNQI